MLREGEMKRFAGEEDKAIVSIPLVVETTIIVVEPRLAIVTIDVEQVQVTITVGISYILPSTAPRLESNLVGNEALISPLNIIWHLGNIVTNRSLIMIT